MRGLASILMIAALSACADTPLTPGPQPEDPDVGFMTTIPTGPPCVYFTVDGVEIPGPTECGDTAFGIDISFGGGPATIDFPGVGPIETPRGITGVRVSFEGPGPDHGRINNLQWKQGTRTIPQSVLPSSANGSLTFDIDVRKFTDVRWIGGGKIDIPANANDLHLFPLLGGT
jgi:hypothetical protein